MTTTEFVYMKFSSPSPLFLSVIVFVLVFGGLDLRAGASNKNGSPFGNGTFFTTSGTFTGVLRGTDLVGVTQFSTTTNASLTGGTVVIYDAALGMYNDGMGVYATMNPAANTLTALILPNTNTAIVTPNPLSTNQDAVPANIFQGGGSFSANLSTQPPNQTYSGNGVITQIPDTTTNNSPPLNMPFSITGCRISSQ